MADELVAYLAEIRAPLGSTEDWVDQLFENDPRETEGYDVRNVRQLVERDA